MVTPQSTIKFKYWVISIKKKENLILELNPLDMLDIIGAHLSKKDDNQKFYCIIDHSKKPMYSLYYETKTRKRLSTMELELNVLIDTCFDVRYDFYTKSLEFEGIKSKNPNLIRSIEENQKFDPDNKKSEEEENEVNLIEASYNQMDILVLNNESKRFPWQNKLLSLLMNVDNDNTTIKQADDREVLWIQDSEGNTGKSKFLKWLCFTNPEKVCKLSFGTSSQLRNAIVLSEKKLIYFIDIPKAYNSKNSDATMSQQMNDLISVIEDLKNGHISSVMYGKFKSQLFNPPHVIIFSNLDCPETLLSEDRWKVYQINAKNKELVPCHNLMNFVNNEPITEEYAENIIKTGMGLYTSI